MAHFAELDKNNKVLRVVVISNDETHGTDGVENEALGIAFCKSLFGSDTNWVQTSYSGSMRHKFAGAGDVFDVKRNAFITPSQYASWVLDEETLSYNPPVAYPSEDGFFLWNEETVSWVEETPTAIE